MYCKLERSNRNSLTQYDQPEVPASERRGQQRKRATERILCGDGYLGLEVRPNVYEVKLGLSVCVRAAVLGPEVPRPLALGPCRLLRRL
jgi:hypothetical protein